MKVTELIIATIKVEKMNILVSKIHTFSYENRKNPKK